MFYIFAYITGGIIIALSLINFAFPSRKISLLIKMSLDFTTVLNLVFILLATKNNLVIAGLVTNVIGVIRDITFYNRNKCKVLNNIAWPIAFSTIFACSLIFTYKSPISVLPVIGSVFSTMTLFANNQKITKIGALIAQSLYLSYYAILIPSSDVLTVFSLVSAVTGLTGTIVGLVVIFVKERQVKQKMN